jgi:Gpi18-like mannosyltransferase
MRIKFQRVINPETLLFVVIVVMALLLRFSLRSYPSFDFLEFGRDWYWYLRKAGFEAFSKDFYNYTPLYLYLLFLISLVRPPISAITAVKLPAIIADFILAGYGSQIVKLRYPNGSWNGINGRK